MFIVSYFLYSTQNILVINAISCTSVLVKNINTLNCCIFITQIVEQYVNKVTTSMDEILQ